MPQDVNAAAALNWQTVRLTGNSAHATFNLSPFDPGAGNTTTFTLTQVPTIPEPETYAMLLAGLLLMGSIAGTPWIWCSSF